MNFRTYLAESEKTFTYRIKSISDLRDSFAAVELFLQRYQLISAQKPKKTIIQRNPVDFPSVTNREVYIMDVTLGMPMSSYVLQVELAKLFGLPESYVVVRGENDPIEQQVSAIDQMNDIAAQADKKKLTAAPLMGTESEYPEAEQTADGSNYYGDSYNSRFLAHLLAIADERKEAEKVDAPAPLFKWLDMPKGEKDAGFNKDIDAPEVKPVDKSALNPSQYGNFDDEGKQIKKTYLNKDGKAKTVSAKTNNVRKD